MITSFIDDIVDEFIECEDGSEALKTYSEHQPNVVLMDIGMKQMDGFIATKEIKSKFQWRGLHRLAMGHAGFYVKLPRKQVPKGI